MVVGFLKKWGIFFSYLFVGLYTLTCSASPLPQENDEIEYIKYLISTEKYTSAIILLSDLQVQENYSPAFKDTLSFYKGLCHFYLKQLPEAVEYFSSIDPSHAFFNKSALLMMYCKMYLKQPISLSFFSLCDSLLYKTREYPLYMLQKSCYYLLSGDSLSYKEIYTKILSQRNTFSPLILQTCDTIFYYYQHQQKMGKKNPLMAAFLSLALPGLGKFYANKKREALLSFLTILLFATASIEQYLKTGPTHPQFITFGIITGLFYIGNIEGSYFAALRKNHENNELFHQNIMAELLLPLRFYLF